MKREYLETIEGVTIGSENQAGFKKNALNLDMLLYKDCRFENFDCDTIRDADYKSCTFNNITFYWTLFNLTHFTNCHFSNCTFQGVNFADCTFLECVLEHCKFTTDNQGRKCHFENLTVIKCRIDELSSIGFKV